MPPTNQAGTFHRPDGKTVQAVGVRERGAGKWDIRVGDMLLQQVYEGTEPGCFRPHGREISEALAALSIPARLVPRYIPIWHAVVLGVPVAAVAAILTDMIWHWLTR